MAVSNDMKNFKASDHIWKKKTKTTTTNLYRIISNKNQMMQNRQARYFVSIIIMRIHLWVRCVSLRIYWIQLHVEHCCISCDWYKTLLTRPMSQIRIINPIEYFSGMYKRKDKNIRETAMTFVYSSQTEFRWNLPWLIGNGGGFFFIFKLTQSV